MRLDGPQQKQFRDALLSAFPDYDTLEQMVLFGLNENLNAIVGRDKLTKVAFDLIKWSIARGRIEELFDAALRENPQNRELSGIISQLRSSTSQATAEQSDLEKIIQSSVNFTDVDVLLERINFCSRAICRIEIPEGSVTNVSTGFLLGPNIVVTNYHAIESVIADPTLKDNVICRFDYKTDKSGNDADEDVPRSLIPHSKWLLSSSPVHELDYALLHIVTEYPKEQTRLRRTWLTPQQHTFVSHEPLIIIQHPHGFSMKIAIGFVDKTDSSQNRVYYTTNTLGGSSGSPCFDSNMSLVALHKGGNASNNYGIPFSNILADLQTKELSSLLGK